jgi:sn-glycerol 3-phosphate transport system ATP-binding protein
VAGFIGSPATNFLDASVFGRGTQGQIGIRPEHAHVTAAAQGKLQAVAVFNEALGAETLVHVKRAGATEVFTIRQDGAQPVPAPGETIGIDWSEADVMTFSADGHRT